MAQRATIKRDILIVDCFLATNAIHIASSVCFRSTFMSLLLPTVVSVIYLRYAHWCTRNGKHVTNQFCASTV